jgi:hypothetical protein
MEEEERVLHVYDRWGCVRYGMSNVEIVSTSNSRTDPKAEYHRCCK